MKFCVKCGNQLDENSAFCAACGTRVEEEAPVKAPEESAAPAPAPAKKGGLLAFIGDMLAIVTSFFYAVAIASANLDVNVYYNKYSAKISAYGYFEPEAGCAIFGFILALGAIAMGVIGLIATIKNRGGKEGLFDAIKKLAIGTFLAILGIVLMANI